MPPVICSGSWLYIYIDVYNNHTALQIINFLYKYEECQVRGGLGPFFLYHVSVEVFFDFERKTRCAINFVRSDSLKACSPTDTLIFCLIIGRSETIVALACDTLAFSSTIFSTLASREFTAKAKRFIDIDKALRALCMRAFVACGARIGLRGLLHGARR